MNNRKLLATTLLIALVFTFTIPMATARDVSKDVTVPPSSVVYGSITLGLKDEGNGWMTMLNGSVNTQSGILGKLYVFSEDNWYNFTHDLPFKVSRKVQDIGTTPKYFTANITNAGTWFIVLDNRGDPANAKVVHFEFDYTYIRVIDGYYNLPSALKTQWVEYTITENSVREWNILWGGQLSNIVAGDILRFEVVDLVDYAWRMNSSWVGGLYMRFLRNTMLKGVSNGTTTLGIYGLIVLPPVDQFWIRAKAFLENNSMDTANGNTKNVTIFINSIQTFYRKVFQCTTSWDGNITMIYSRTTGVLLQLTYNGFPPYEGTFKFQLTATSKPAQLGSMSTLTLSNPGSPQSTILLAFNMPSFGPQLLVLTLVFITLFVMASTYCILRKSILWTQ